MRHLIPGVLSVLLMGCGTRDMQPFTAVAVTTDVREMGTHFFYPPMEPACYSMDRRAKHLVLLTLGGEARYYHRDADTRAWMGNLGVRRVRTTMRFVEGEWMRTGEIHGFSDTILTVRFADGGKDYFVFPNALALRSFLGRIVGPRGVPRRELRRTTIIALDESCGKAQSR